MVRVLIVLLGLIASAGAQLIGEHFAARGNALAVAKAELSKGTSLKATFYAKQIAESLKDAASCDCGKLSTLLAKESDALEIFYGLSVAKSCKCSDAKLSASQKEQIQQGLESSELAGLVGAALASKAAGLPLEGKTVVEKILDLSTPDGTFKSDSGVPGKGSLKNAKLALQALSVLGSAAGSNSKLEKVLEGALQLLPSGEADGDSTVVDPTLLVYLKAQAEKTAKISEFSQPRQFGTDLGKRILSTENIIKPSINETAVTKTAPDTSDAQQKRIRNRKMSVAGGDENAPGECAQS